MNGEKLKMMQQYTLEQQELISYIHENIDTNKLTFAQQNDFRDVKRVLETTIAENSRLQQEQLTHNEEATINIAKLSSEKLQELDKEFQR